MKRRVKSFVMVFLLVMIILSPSHLPLNARELGRESLPGGTAPYLWYFGDWQLFEQGDSVPMVQIARQFPLVLVHPSNSDLTPELVTEIRVGEDGRAGTDDDVLVIGYVSIGEQLSTDKDHMRPPEEGDRMGPVYWDYEQSQMVYQQKGVASFYLDDRDRDGYPDRNWQYQGCYANPGDPVYQEFLKQATKEGDGFAGFDELIDRYHCDGFFLDTMDVVNPLSWGFPFYFEWTAPGGLSLIRQLREWFPNKIILLNRTLVFFDANQYRSDGSHYLVEWGLEIGQLVDLVLFEGFYWPGDEVRNRWYWGPRLNAEADRTGGFTILALDYVGDAEIEIDGLFGDWLSGGTERQGVEKLDNALIWSRGAYTPDEAADTDFPSVDILDIWAANSVDNAVLSFLITFASPPDTEIANYTLFLDTDQDSSTGYIPPVSGNGSTPSAAAGADCLVQDRKTGEFSLYQFIDTSPQNAWAWQQIGKVSQGTGPMPPPFEGTYGLELSVPAELAGLHNTFTEAVNLYLHAELRNEAGAAQTSWDLAPNDAPDEFYQFLMRTKELSVEQTFSTQGWSSYIKPLLDGTNAAPVDWYASEHMDRKDRKAPVWTSTAASPGVLPPAPPLPRVGLQEAEPGDGEVTLRWDVCEDQSRPVTYSVYMSETYPIVYETCRVFPSVDTGTPGKNYIKGTGLRSDFPNGRTSRDGFYSATPGEGVYPYEYTVSGLENGKTYYFSVRAADSAAPPNEDTNTVTLSAVPFAHVPGGVIIDGEFDDWQDKPFLDFSPGEESSAGMDLPQLDLIDFQATHDDRYLYLRVALGGDAPLAWSEYVNIFIDADQDQNTGYSGHYIPDFPWAIGADYLIQNGVLLKHVPVEGWRVWNWDSVEPLAHAEGAADGRSSSELSIPLEHLVNPLIPGERPRFVLQLSTEKIIDGDSQIIDRAPNDPFSHAYAYAIAGD